jgi:hypothetical protein
VLTFPVTKGPGMDTITELASDERRARIALACMTEPGDAVTSGLVGEGRCCRDGRPARLPRGAAQSQPGGVGTV